MRWIPAILLSSAVLALSPMSASGQNTQKLSTGKANEYGLVYSLPKTVIDVIIEVKHSVSVPGQFYNYAKRYLGVDNVIVDDARTASIESVTMIARGVAQPDQAWLAKFKNGANVSMTLNDADVPLAINCDVETIKKDINIPIAKPAMPTPLEVPEAQQAITQEMSATASLSKKAQLAAQRIFELRETRNELLGGSADNMPPDGKAMELILENIAAQEAALMAMFIGTTQDYTTVTTVPVMIDKEKLDNVVIARLSPVNGLVDASDLSGDPIELALSDVVIAKLPTTEKGEPKAFPKGGVAYTIPGSATIAIKFDGETIAAQSFEVAQLGMTFGLDPAQFTDKKAPAFVEFSPVTGGIVRLGTLPANK